MQNYKMIWEPKNDDPAWEYSFTQPSDKMASDYARKQYERAHVRLGCMGLLVVNLDTDTVIAHYRTNRIQYETVNVIDTMKEG